MDMISNENTVLFKLLVTNANITVEIYDQVYVLGYIAAQAKGDRL